MNFEDITISTYVNNLPERTDRRECVIQTFKDHPEFDLHIMNAVKRPRGADGLWESIVRIVKQAQEDEEEVIIICEDDHVFTPDYNRDVFLTNVINAGRLGCHILYGGIGNYHNVVPITNHLLWVDWSWCAQFMVVYKPAFRVILDAKFGEKDVADEFLSTLLPNKMVVYPFISVQKEFGYSDVTASNNKPGTITKYFVDTKKRIDTIIEKYNQYCQ